MADTMLGHPHPTKEEIRKVLTTHLPVFFNCAQHRQLLDRLMSTPQGALVSVMITDPRFAKAKLEGREGPYGHLPTVLLDHRKKLQAKFDGKTREPNLDSPLRIRLHCMSYMKRVEEEDKDKGMLLTYNECDADPQDGTDEYDFDGPLRIMDMGSLTSNVDRMVSELDDAASFVHRKLVKLNLLDCKESRNIGLLSTTGSLIRHLTQMLVFQCMHFVVEGMESSKV